MLTRQLRRDSSKVCNCWGVKGGLGCVRLLDQSAKVLFEIAQFAFAFDLALPGPIASQVSSPGNEQHFSRFDPKVPHFSRKYPPRETACLASLPAPSAPAPYRGGWGWPHRAARPTLARRLWYDASRLGGSQLLLQGGDVGLQLARLLPRVAQVDEEHHLQGPKAVKSAASKAAS